MKVTLDDEVISEVPLIALDPVEKGGWFKRFRDSILRFFIGLFG